MSKTAPCGSWQSPITAELLTSKSISIYDPKLVDDDVYWVEMRPGNEGRYALVRQTFGQRPRDLVSGQYSVRTKVHEYGGNPYGVLDGKVLFSNFADDCLYTWRSSGRRRIEQFLPPNQCRYADFVVNRSTGPRGPLRAQPGVFEHAGDGGHGSARLGGRHGSGPRLLFLPRSQPGWNQVGLAGLEPSRHAVGRN